MTQIKQLVEIKQRADQKRRQSDFAYAVTGKYKDDGSGDLTLNENLQTNQMHARLGGPTGQPVVVNFTGFDGTIGVGVIIRRNPINGREWELYGADFTTARQSFTAALSALFEAAIPGELARTTIVARQLQMLRVSKTATASMTVRVKPGWLAVDGALNWFSGSTSSTITAPASSNQRQWLLVGIDVDTLALTTQAGTARASTGKLSMTELKTLISSNPGVYWSGAVELFNGMTAIYEDDITDLRAFAPDLGRAPLAYVAQTTNYTATAADEIIDCDATAAPFAVTLPTAVGITGKRYDVRKNDATGNAITVTPDGSETIDGAASASISTQYTNLTLVSDGANWMLL